MQTLLKSLTRPQIATRIRGIDATQLLVENMALAELTDESVLFLKRQWRNQGSDQVLTIASNILAGSTWLEHIELWHKTSLLTYSPLEHA